MPRPQNTVPTDYLHVGLPKPLADKVRAHLTSEFEGRIPQGRMQEFFTALVEGYFNHLESGK